MKDLSLHILDILRNSIEAGAGRIELRIEEDSVRNQLVITIIDNGRGLDETELALITDPFYTTRNTRKVGLGLPLFKQKAEQTGGNLRIASSKGFGTMVQATFGLHHIDRPPLGDLEGTLALTLATCENVDIIFEYITPQGSYRISSMELKEVMDGINLNHAEIISAVREMIFSNLSEIGIERQ